jgi:CrcB protein
MRVPLIAVAGSLGALCRYGIGLAFGGPDFPWATLGINVAGSFVLGAVLVAGPSWFSPDVVAAVGIGFLGAFTTFSTFSNETQNLFRDGRPVAAMAYVALSCTAGITAAALGHTLASAVKR